MNLTSKWPGVSLTDLLSAKDLRAQRQQAWLTRWQVPLLSLTLVTPGPVKNSIRYRDTLAAALQACDKLLWRNGWQTRAREVFWLETGPEAFWSVDHPAIVLKTALIELEEQHPLGRLWDMDVISPQDGPVSRHTCGLPPRRCLICSEHAHACSRSRAHPLEQLTGKVEQTIDNWFRRD